MKQVVAAALKSFFTIMVVMVCANSVQAQNSRVSAITSGNKTNVWISDFPKQTSVILTDSDNNLLSIVTTNNFGSAFISLPAAVNADVVVKTLNGEVVATNKVADAKLKDQNLTANEHSSAAKAPKA